MHRVGRTAPYAKGGHALLLLLPSEEQGMLALKARGIEIPTVKIRPSKTLSIKDQLQRPAFQHPDVKYLAQQALESHVRSVHLHHDKVVFNLEALSVEAFADSLELAGALKIRLLSRAQATCTTSPTCCAVGK
jgi:ATP-dependent RNA helicase DDX10/DBP4